MFSSSGCTGEGVAVMDIRERRVQMSDAGRLKPVQELMYEISAVIGRGDTLGHRRVQLLCSE